MRELAIAYGNSRQAKKWVNKTVKFDALKARLKSTMYTTESVEEYRKMNKAKTTAALWQVSLKTAGAKSILWKSVP